MSFTLIETHHSGAVRVFVLQDVLMQRHEVHEPLSDEDEQSPPKPYTLLSPDGNSTTTHILPPHVVQAIGFGGA